MKWKVGKDGKEENGRKVCRKVQENGWREKIINGREEMINQIKGKENIEKF